MTTAAAYMPVVHKGHLQFCQLVKPDVLYILGRSFIDEMPMLERDIRALHPDDIVKTCRVLSLAPTVAILEKDTMHALRSAPDIVFTDDDAMHAVADIYFPGMPVRFERVFLRWDKMAAITAHPVDADSVISQEDFDLKIMFSAREQSQKSSDWWRQVGAVIVKSGTPILMGYNQHQPSQHSPYTDGDPRANFNAGDPLLKDMHSALHGEAALIAQAARQGISLEGADIYATTFPCPACAMSIVEAGIRAVYYADGYSNLSAQENLKLAGVSIIRVQEA